MQQAQSNYKLAVADGSTDPTIGVWFTHNGSFNNPDALNTIGASVSIPLRIFDRNQGEKLRTKIDINRNEKLRDGVETQVYSDVDSAYAIVVSNIALLKPYKRQYLQQAVRVRDTVYLFLSERRRVSARFLQCRKRLPYRATQLREPGRCLSHRRRATEPVRRTRGDPMNNKQCYVGTDAFVCPVERSSTGFAASLPQPDPS